MLYVVKKRGFELSADISEGLLIMTQRIFSFLLVCFLLGTTWGSAHADTLDFKYFTETGHNVQGEFLKFYNANANATLLYGYPITEQFVSKDGKTVQYFQRARFELHTDLPEGQRVQLTALGREIYKPASPLNVNNSFACKSFSENSFPVCFAFLEFFEPYGGVAQFGLPISPFEYHDNMIVQYFEKARFEWQAWKTEGQRVVISDLGRIYFDKLGEDPGFLPQVKPLDNTPTAVNTLQVRAFVWRAVTLANDSQIIYVIVQDQAMQVVSNAVCASVVHWPDGRTESSNINTNTNGVGIVTLSFSDQPYGSLISADVSCAFEEHLGTTTTSFRIWY